MRHRSVAPLALLSCFVFVACDGKPFDVQITAAAAELRNSAATDSQSLRRLEHLSVLQVQKPKPWQSDAFYKLVKEEGFVERKDVLSLPLISEAFTVTANGVATRARDGDGLGTSVGEGTLEVGAVVEVVAKAPWLDDKYLAVVRDGRAIGYIERSEAIPGRASPEALGERCLAALKAGDWSTAAKFAAAISKRSDAPRFFVQVDQLLNHPSDKPKAEAMAKPSWGSETPEPEAFIAVAGQVLQGEGLVVGQPVTVTKLGKRGDEPVAEISVNTVERVLVTGAFATSPPSLSEVTHTQSGVVPRYALTQKAPTPESLEAAIANTQDKVALAALHATRYVPGQSSPEALNAFVAAAVAAERADLLLKALRPSGDDHGLTGPAILLGCVGDPGKATFSDGKDADELSRLESESFAAAPHCLANYDSTAPCEPSLVQDQDCGPTPAECAAAAAKRKRQLAERLKVYKKELLPPYKRAMAKLASYKNPAFVVPAPVAEAKTPDGVDVIVYRYSITSRSTGPCESAIVYGGERAEMSAFHLSAAQARAALFVAIPSEHTVGWRYGVALTDDGAAVKSWLARIGAGEGRDPMLAFKFVEAPVVAADRCASTCDTE